MHKFLYFLWFLSSTLFAQGVSDPAFSKVSFDEWLSGPDQLHFHWTVKPAHAELTFHQRLLATIDVAMDGKDLDPRRDHGELVVFLQITDSAGVHYQSHGSVELNQMDPDIKKADVYFSERAFALPGEYKLGVVLLDSKTQEHAAMQTTFRVQEKIPDFLQQAWQALPAIEFIEDDDVSPEAWYLPKIRERVKWATPAKAPAVLNVVMNVGLQKRLPSAALEGLLPALKLIATSGAANVTTNVAVIDLGRHKALFEQRDVQDLDWRKLKDSLRDSSAASIDLHSLENRKDDAQFFLSEIRRVIRATEGKACVVVVLSPIAMFEGKEDRTPISTEALPDCQVVYIRSHRIPGGSPFLQPRISLGRVERDMRFRSGPMPYDELAPMLKPLNPKVMDVFVPAEWTKALVEIRKALGE